MNFHLPFLGEHNVHLPSSKTKIWNLDPSLLPSSATTTKWSPTSRVVVKAFQSLSTSGTSSTSTYASFALQGSKWTKLNGATYVSLSHGPSSPSMQNLQKQDKFWTWKNILSNPTFLIWWKPRMPSTIRTLNWSTLLTLIVFTS
jgi:hypothetical protein